MTKPNSSDMRQRILSISAELISKNGIKSTSLADISRAVGISKGTLYYYYSSKDDIIFDITDIHLNDITHDIMKWIEKIDNQMNREEIIRIVVERITKVEARGRLHLYIVSEAITGNSDLAVRLKQNYISWRKTIKYGIEKVFKDKNLDVEAFSFIIMSVIDGLTIQWLLQTEDIPFELISKFMVK